MNQLAELDDRIGPYVENTAAISGAVVAIVYLFMLGCELIAEVVQK